MTEYFFFEEFNSRFNAVSADYLIYPGEVFINIWQSYNVLLLVAICLAAGIPVSLYIYKKIKNSNEAKNRDFSPICAIAAYLLVSLFFFSLSPLSGINFSDNRIINEVGKNGISSFIYAAYSHNLDFYHFYATIEPEKAHSIAFELR